MHCNKSQERSPEKMWKSRKFSQYHRNITVTIRYGSWTPHVFLGIVWWSSGLSVNHPAIHGGGLVCVPYSRAWISLPSEELICRQNTAGHHSAIICSEISISSSLSRRKSLGVLFSRKEMGSLDPWLTWICLTVKIFLILKTKNSKRS